MLLHQGKVSVNLKLYPVDWDCGQLIKEATAASVLATTIVLYWPIWSLASPSDAQTKSSERPRCS